MRRYPYKKYLLLVGALFLLLSLPPLFVRSVRGKVFALFSPALKATVSKVDAERERVEAENHLLRVELNKLRAASDVPDIAEQRAVATRVIYRDPGSWSSSVWVDVGERGAPIVQKNSPVIIGRSLVGVVDYVGKRQARVRLISDVALQPSVRAVRGNAQNSALIEHITPLLRHLSLRKDLPINKDEQMALGRALTQFKERLAESDEEWHLAKGVLQGAGTPLWRSKSHTLRGIGFNYDFPDEKGAARPLVDSACPLIQSTDLLVTTGLDGVFPPGLCVAEVTKVFPLREGAYTYEIEAVPSAGDLNALQTLFVIPPVGYDVEEEGTYYESCRS